MLLPITLTMAAAAVLVHLWLVFRCGRIRVQSKVMIGDGGNPLLIARMRAHANFTENTPLFLILLGLVEMGGGTKLWLWAVGILFIAARILHVFGMERSAHNALCGGGMGLNLLILVGLAVYAITLSYMAPHLST